MRAQPDAVAEHLLTAALVDLGDSLDHLGDRDGSCEPGRAVCRSPDLLDGCLFTWRHRYLTAGPRPIDVRWGELLYDLASSAVAPWGSCYPSESVDLVGILRCSSAEAHVIVRAEGVRIFQFPYETWPSGIHTGAWGSICGGLHLSPGGRVHRYTDEGWVSLDRPGHVT